LWDITVSIAHADIDRGLAESIRHKLSVRDKKDTYQFVFVPDVVPSNILRYLSSSLIFVLNQVCNGELVRIGSNIVIPDGFPKSEEILRAEASKRGLTGFCIHHSYYLRFTPLRYAF
jgi:hypothetical protein